MTDHEYRHALALLDSALALAARPPEPGAARHFHALGLQFELLRAALTQSPAATRRN